MSIQVTVYSIPLTCSHYYRCFFVYVNNFIHDHGMVVHIPYVMYRLRGNKVPETGKTRLCHAQQERKNLTRLKTLYMYT